jgi:hypothetical protein
MNGTMQEKPDFDLLLEMYLDGALPEEYREAFEAQAGGERRDEFVQALAQQVAIHDIVEPRPVLIPHRNPSRAPMWISVAAALLLAFGVSWIVSLDSPTVIEDIPEPVALDTEIRAYGGEDEDFFTQMTAMPDGGAVVVGAACSYGDVWGDAILIRYDVDGNPLWTRILGGVGGDGFESVAVDASGNLLAVGTTETTARKDEDIFLTRLTASGEVVWQKTLGTDLDEKVHSVTACPEGGWLVAGTTNLYRINQQRQVEIHSEQGVTGHSPVRLIRLDDNGDVQWQKTFDTTAPLGVGGKRRLFLFKPVLCRSGDGYFVVSGTDRLGDADIWVARLNADGSIDWEKGIGSSERNAYEHIVATPEGGVLLVGQNESDTDANATLIELDRSGSIVRQIVFGSEQFETAYRVTLSDEGLITVVGGTDTERDLLNQNVFLAEFTRTGELKRQVAFRLEQDQMCFGLARHGERIFLSGGTSQPDSEEGYYDGLFIRTDMTGIGSKAAYDPGLVVSEGSLKTYDAVFGAIDRPLEEAEVELPARDLDVTPLLIKK